MKRRIVFSRGHGFSPPVPHRLRILPTGRYSFLWPSLILLPRNFEAFPDGNNPRLLRMQRRPWLFQDSESRAPSRPRICCRLTSVQSTCSFSVSSQASQAPYGRLFFTAKHLILGV